VVAQNDQYGADLVIDSLSDGLITATVNLPPGDYSVWVNACPGDFDPEESGPACDSNALDFVVESPPQCTLKYQSRLVNIAGLGSPAGHSYLHFINPSTNPVYDQVLEGYPSGGFQVLNGNFLLAQATDHGADIDQKGTDTIYGSVQGAFVCDWLALIKAGIDRINAASPLYFWYPGPNSNSAARYLLQQTPTTFTPWFTVPYFAVGFYYHIPGLEP